MIPTLLPLGTFLLVQLCAATWWASRVSTQLDTLTKCVHSIGVDVSNLRAVVQAHDTSIAVIRATSKPPVAGEVG